MVTQTPHEIAADIVPAIDALAPELDDLASASAQQPVACDAGNVSAKLVRRSTGGHLLLAWRWGGAAGPLPLRCALPPEVSATSAHALDGPGQPRRTLPIANRTLRDTMERPFKATAFWLE